MEEEFAGVTVPEAVKNVLSVLASIPAEVVLFEVVVSGVVAMTSVVVVVVHCTGSGSGSHIWHDLVVVVECVVVELQSKALLSLGSVG
jgi:hypothetical protein